MFATTPVFANQSTGTWFICPSVSTNNPNGMWVIGLHGGYYVIVPTNDAGDKTYVTVPVQVDNLAQIPAGWALYKDAMPTFPNFQGMAGILSEGIYHWISGTYPGGPTTSGYVASQWNEGDMVMVTITSTAGTGTTVVHDMTSGAMVTINGYIPLNSDAIW
jgi:hypothetical protein